MENSDNILNEKLTLFSKEITATMKRAYWDKLSEDLKNKNYESTIQILKEIRSRICLFAPSRIDLHQQIAEHIDVDLLNQMITHDAITPDIISSIINYIITQIKDFGALADEHYNEIWREQMNRKFKAEEPLEVIFPIFFKEAYHRIERIEYEIEFFKKTEIYKSIIEQKEQKEKEKLD